MRVGRRSKATRLSEYQDEVLRARRWREEQGYDLLWARLREMYEGADNRVSDIPEDADRVAVNMAFSTINVMYPSVSAGIPQISVLANDPQYDDNAVVVQEVMNFAWKHWNVQPAFRRAAKDFLMFGHGWAKVGWRYVEEERELTDQELVQMYAEARSQVVDAGVADPSMIGSLPTDDEILANLPSTKMVPLEDRPFVEHVSVLDMYVNPEATNMDDIRWIAQRVIRHVEDVKNDSKYQAKVSPSETAKAAGEKSATKPGSSLAKLFAMRGGTPATIASQPSQIRPASSVKVIMPNQSKALAAPRRSDSVAGAASSISGGSSGRALRLRGSEKTT